jgi:adenylosuccinate synthase
VVHSSVSSLCITKLDVLDGLETIRIAVGYRIQGSTVPEMPVSLDGSDLEPIYEEMPGWRESTFGITDYGALPANARRYLERLAELTEVPISMISTGPDREQTIMLSSVF